MLMNAPVGRTPFPRDYDPLRDLRFISLRTSTSYVSWLKSLWKYSVEKGTVISFKGMLEDLSTAFIVESLWSNKKEANLYLWTRDVDFLRDAIEVVRGIARFLGFSSLRLMISEDIYRKCIEGRYHCEILNEYFLLYRRL